MNEENKKMKKIMPIIIIAILVIAIIIIPVFLGGKKSDNTAEPATPEKQAEQSARDFIDAFNTYDAEKLVASMDMAGSLAWGYLYGETKLTEEEYNNFVSAYEAVSAEEAAASNTTMKMIYEQSFKEIKSKYSEYSMNIDKVEETKKIGDDLYGITIQRTTKGKKSDETQEEINETDTVTFIIYKNKVIFTGI